jgi:hypothetical protein
MNLPDDFDSAYVDARYLLGREFLDTYLEAYGTWYPTGYGAFEVSHRDIFVILAREPGESRRHFMIGYFTHRMDFIELSSTHSEQHAFELLKHWCDMDDFERRFALWANINRSPSLGCDLQLQAQRWNSLTPSGQQAVMALLRAGAPGDIDQIIDAAQACGLVTRTE